LERYAFGQQYRRRTNAIEKPDYQTAGGRSMSAQSRRLLRLHAVMELVPLSESTIYDRIKRGEFPKQVSIGGNKVAWLQSEIEAWIEDCIAARGRENICHEIE
jgi:prophage regulatory protein